MCCPLERILQRFRSSGNGDGRDKKGMSMDRLQSCIFGDDGLSSPSNCQKAVVFKYSSSERYYKSF